MRLVVNEYQASDVWTAIENAQNPSIYADLTLAVLDSAQRENLALSSAAINDIATVSFDVK